MNASRIRALGWFLLPLSLLVVASTSVNTWNHFTSVPVFDAWDFYVNFYLTWLQGGYSILWEPYSEHRILLPKLLYLVDIEWFGGRGVFLTLFSYFLQGVFSLVSYVIATNLDDKRIHTGFFAALCLACAYSGLQWMNFVYSFQVCFILVYVMAFLSFTFLSLAQRNEGEKLYFFLALAFAAGSSFSVANGLLVWPVLIGQSVLMGMKRSYVAALVVAGVSVWCTYYLGMGDSGQSISTLNPFSSDLWRILIFLLSLFGAPVYYVFDSLVLAQIAGLAFLLLALAALLDCLLRGGKKRELRFCLLAQVGFVIGSGLAMAVGRGSMGEEYAFTSRYLTPVLQGWLCLLILLLTARFGFVPRRANAAVQSGSGLLALSFLLLVLVAQWNVRNARINDFDEFDRRVALIGLKHGVFDDQLGWALYFPGPPWLQTKQSLVRIATEAMQAGFSVFDDDWLKPLYPYDSLGRPLTVDRVCDGGIDKVDAYGGAGQTSVLRLRGHVVAPAYSKIIVTDNSGRLLGHGLSGDRGRSRVHDSVPGDVGNLWYAFIGAAAGSYVQELAPGSGPITGGLPFSDSGEVDTSALTVFVEDNLSWCRLREPGAQVFSAAR
jgi:hypothetical protein